MVFRPGPRGAPVEIEPMLGELQDFCQHTGRRPALSSTERQEFLLAQWVLRTRNRRAYRPFIDQVIYQWPVREPERLEQYRAFCQAHGRRPAKRYAPAEEETLARWASEAKYRPDPEPELLSLWEAYPSRAEAATPGALIEERAGQPHT